MERDIVEEVQLLIILNSECTLLCAPVVCVVVVLSTVCCTTQEEFFNILKLYCLPTTHHIAKSSKNRDMT